MKFAISGQSLGKIHNLKETLDLIKNWGIDAIEIWPCNIAPLSGSVSEDTYENRDVEAAVKMLQQKKMQVSAVSFSGSFVAELVGDKEHYQQELIRAVETAHVLGAKVVNHYCYYLSLHALDIEQIKAYMMPAIELAAHYGITLALENEAHDRTQTPQGMKEILNGVSHPAFLTNLDATNYYEAGVEGFPYAYEVLKPYLAYVHIKNGCRPKEASEKNISYVTLDAGAVNIAGLLNRLTKDGYEGYCVLEPHCPVEQVEEQLKADVQWLDRIKGCWSLKVNAF